VILPSSRCYSFHVEACASALAPLVTPITCAMSAISMMVRMSSTNILVSAVVASLVTVLIEVAAKPRLDARKARILRHYQVRLDIAHQIRVIAMQAGVLANGDSSQHGQTLPEAFEEALRSRKARARQGVDAAAVRLEELWIEGVHYLPKRYAMTVGGFSILAQTLFVVRSSQEEAACDLRTIAEMLVRALEPGPWLVSRGRAFLKAEARVRELTGLLPSGERVGSRSL
jgi:hypothetical protein